MWKIIRKAARSSWFTSRQWKTEPTCTTETDHHSSNIVSTHYNLFTRNENISDNEHGNSNKRKRSSYKDEYGFFRIHPSFLEAVSWLGTSFVLAVNLKCKLYHFHHNLCYQYEDKENNNTPCMRHALRTSFANFWSFAFSMPNTRKAVLPSVSRNETTKPTKATLNGEKTKNSEHLSSSEKGYEEMKIASDKYIGHIENTIGLQLLAKDPVHAFHHFNVAADLGCNKANFNLGLCCELGKGTEQDLAKAVHYYQLAAADEHGFAMYNLGIYYIDGLGGLEQNSSLGLQLIRKAADVGVPEAQNFMGIHCLDNEKWDEAFKYFKLSAQQNFADSHYYLGLCYENGWGVSINYVKAVEHFSSAAISGHLEAKVSLQSYPDKDARKNSTQNKEQQNTATSIHSSSSSPELSRMSSPTQPHPLTDFNVSSYLNMNIHSIWQKVDHKRNFWLDSNTVSHLDDELPHWASTPSLLTVT